MAEGGNKIVKVSVDRNLCIGAATCVISADSVFELDGENKAVMKLKGGEKKSDPAERGNLENDAISDDALMEAAQSCPTKAIFLYDAEGKQVYP